MRAVIFNGVENVTVEDRPVPQIQGETLSSKSAWQPCAAVTCIGIVGINKSLLDSFQVMNSWALSTRLETA